ncbi:facilitated trehalose transporter Tret1-like [Phymastichus coffea]|uniref:facilitated trehalose transporter Tret1-like n=1 Tax=Phymastichus coffea TaxID=108790 RepID=UPI00273B21A0|nr:facilitated trehalose transporter Tret1-like [Phymastichus coffea]
MKKPQEAIKSAASQCLAAFATNLVKFTYGSFHGITTILLAELYKKNAEIEISLSELTWFGSSCFMVPVGSILSGLLAQTIGPRRCLIVTSLLFIVSWILFYFAKNSVMLLGAQAIAGLVAPAIIGPGTTYIVETAEPYLRSALMASTNLSIIIGVFLTILYSNWLHWRTIVLINLISPTLGFLSMYMIPESPHWLASKGKLKQAESALSWVRGWTTPENIFLEFDLLRKTYEIPDRSSTRNSCKPFFPYLMIIFKSIDAPIDSHLAASLFDAMRILGAIVCILSVHYTGKRKLIFISSIGAGLSYITIATLLFLKAQSAYVKYIHVFNWTSTIMLILSTFLTSAGIDKVVFMYNAELFPTKFRNVGTGIGIFVFSVCSAVVNKSYLYVVAAVTLPGAFLIFGISCFVCCIVFYFLLPETEGKTLRELENHYVKTIKDANL